MTNDIIRLEQALAAYKLVPNVANWKRVYELATDERLLKIVSDSRKA